MTINGKLSPLAINAQAELFKNSGFEINSLAVQYQGMWLPNSYTPGSIVNLTLLKSLTESLARFYNLAKNSQISASIYRSILNIGSNVCPALANSRPDTFKPSYAGFGTWKRGTVDSFGNFVANNAQPLALVDKNYPPENYPTSNSSSYIFDTYSRLGYLVSWPDRASWQKPTDTYKAALPPVSSTDPIGDYDEYFSNGFIATVARQAYYEFWYNYETRRINQYSEFSNYIQQTYQFLQQSNQTIGSFVNGKSFLRGNFSNINDLTTSDIAGVSLAFKDFGNDCIRLGKAIDLSQIHRFGTPSVLLLTLQKYNALTDAVKLALIYSNLNTVELNDILESNYTPTPEQEKRIYNAFTLVRGQDLSDVLIILNTSTTGLDSLDDLLNPKAMFPNSYPSLTIPRYSINTASNKIYDFIYVNGGVNSRIENWGSEYLDGILSQDLVVACGAFMMTMNQIKNIRQMEFEKVAQVIANLEVTSKDLPDVALATSPVNQQFVNQTTANIALGSGNSGVYRVCDFLGSVSGYPYRDYYSVVLPLLQQLATPELSTVYEKLSQKSLFNDWALLSGGNGWAAPNPKLVYTLFTTVESASTAFNTVKTVEDITSILAVNDKISFDNNGAVNYTVTNVSFDGVNTIIQFTPGLVSNTPANSRIYVNNTNYDTSIQNLIDAANSEIQRIATLNISGVKQLNFWWSQIGKQLYTEQRAIPCAIPDLGNVYQDANKQNIVQLVDSISTYAQDTQYCGMSPILDAVSDKTTVGGQSIVAMMRETRNSQRLANTFGELDDDIDSELHPQQASAVVSETNSSGGITKIDITFAGYGYDDAAPPEVTIGPYGGVFGGSGYGASAVAVVNSGMITEIVIVDSGQEYLNPQQNGPYEIYIDPPPQPQRLGDATEPGSFAGSPYTGQDPVPDNLVAPASASYTVQEAIELVTQCNCDCWDM